MGSKDKRSVKDILEAIEGSGGIKQIVAERLNVHRHTIANYQQRYPSVSKALQDEMEVILDKAESNLFTIISEGDITTSQWLLKYKAKDRGYVEKSEQKIEGSIETIIKVHYEDEDK